MPKVCIGGASPLPATSRPVPSWLTSPGQPIYTVCVVTQLLLRTDADGNDVASCTVDAAEGSSPYTDRSTCACTATAATSNQTTCTPLDQTGNATMTGNKVVCAFDSTPTTTNNLATCTVMEHGERHADVSEDLVFLSHGRHFQIQRTTFLHACDCSVRHGEQHGLPTPPVTCAFDSTPPTTTNNLATCTNVDTASGGMTSQRPRVPITATGLSNQTTCTPATAASGTANKHSFPTPAVTCAFDSTPTTTDNLATVRT